MTTDMASAPPEDDAPGGTFAKPAPLPPAKAEALRQAERREDDPPPEVPRDQWERPIIVLLDGSGAASYLRASKLGKVKRSRSNAGTGATSFMGCPGRTTSSCAPRGCAP